MKTIYKLLYNYHKRKYMKYETKSYETPEGNKKEKYDLKVNIHYYKCHYFLRKSIKNYKNLKYLDKDKRYDE